MYLAIDIGGTKTLLASFDKDGNIKKRLKFPTPKDYQEFLKELASNISNLGENSFTTVGVGVPGVLNRQNDVVIKLGNLPWTDEPIKADIEKIVGCPVFIENDAKLAGLFESNKLQEYKKVLYVTFGTGIGVAIVSNGEIDLSVDDSGGKDMMLEYQGKKQSWEEFASGRAIVKAYGKKAQDIDDENAWKEIAEGFAVGIQELIATYNPDAVVIGGGIGQYFNKYGQFLDEALRTNEAFDLPALLPASHAEEAVLYGCYELIKIHAGASK